MQLDYQKAKAEGLSDTKISQLSNMFGAPPVGAPNNFMQTPPSTGPATNPDNPAAPVNWNTALAPTIAQGNPVSNFIGGMLTPAANLGASLGDLGLRAYAAFLPPDARQNLLGSIKNTEQTGLGSIPGLGANPVSADTTVGGVAGDVVKTGITLASFGAGPEIEAGLQAAPSAADAFAEAGGGGAGLKAGAATFGINALNAGTAALPYTAGYAGANILQGKTNTPGWAQGVLGNNSVLGTGLGIAQNTIIAGLMAPVLNRIINKAGEGITSTQNAYRGSTPDETGAGGTVGGIAPAFKTGGQAAINMLDLKSYLKPIGPVNPAQLIPKSVDQGDFNNPPKRETVLAAQAQGRQSIEALKNSASMSATDVQTHMNNIKYASELAGHKVASDLATIYPNKAADLQSTLRNSGSTSLADVIPSITTDPNTEVSNIQYNPQTKTPDYSASIDQANARLAENAKASQAIFKEAPENTIPDRFFSEDGTSTGNSLQARSLKNAEGAQLGQQGKTQAGVNNFLNTAIQEKFNYRDPITGEKVSQTIDPREDLTPQNLDIIRQKAYAASITDISGSLEGQITNNAAKAVAEAAKSMLIEKYPEYESVLDRRTALTQAKSFLNDVNLKPLAGNKMQNMEERALFWTSLSKFGWGPTILMTNAMDRGFGYLSNPARKLSEVPALNMSETDVTNMALREAKMRTGAQTEAQSPETQAQVADVAQKTGLPPEMITNDLQQTLQGTPPTQNSLNYLDAMAHLQNTSRAAAATAANGAMADSIQSNVASNPMTFKALGDDEDSITTKLKTMGVPEEIASKRAAEIAELNKGRTDKNLTPAEYKQGMEATLMGIGQDIKKLAGKLSLPNTTPAAQAVAPQETPIAPAGQLTTEGQSGLITNPSEGVPLPKREPSKNPTQDPLDLGI